MIRHLPWHLILAGLFLGSCVAPQEVTLIEREQRQLRVENNQMRKDLDGIRSHVADSRATLQEMQSRLDALREKVGEVSHQMDLRIGQSSLQDNQKAANLDSRITRMDDELRAQGALLRAREQELQVLREAVLRAASGGVDTAALQREPPSSPASTQPGMVDPARSDYEEAWRHLEKKEYRDAIARMNEFIKKHPESDYADNAQYWIGESYYALKQFDQAILEFDAVRRKYPKGDKVPAALLKQGFAFAELGDKVDARLILQELIARYPETPEAVKAQEKVKALES